MDPNKGHPPAWVPKGLKKSDSNASSSALSIRSHKSVKAIGAYPFGTLQVHDADSDMPPLAEETSPGHFTGGGDAVIILDLPETFNVGYDIVSFTAKHFVGIKHLPSGAHFLWVAHPSGLSTRCGAWIVSAGTGQVHVLQWDSYNEVLVESSTAEARIQASNVHAIQEKLLSYRNPAAAEKLPSESEANLRIWHRLAGSVSETALTRITGEKGGHWFCHTADRVEGLIRMAAEVELDRRVSNAFLQNRELKFMLSQLEHTYSTDDYGADRTLDATDATSYILAALGHQDGLTEQDLVGEFQFVFVVGMHLGNDSCITQWWHMVLKVVLRAFLLPIRRPTLAASLLKTLAAQLLYSTSKLETSILDHSDSLTNELRLALIIYKKRLKEVLLANKTSDVNLALEYLVVSDAFTQIETAVSPSPLEWNLSSDNYLRSGKVRMEDGEEVEISLAELEAEDERGEWAPAVVDLDESGKEKGLVSWTD